MTDSKISQDEWNKLARFFEREAEEYREFRRELRDIENWRRVRAGLPPVK